MLLFRLLTLVCLFSASAMAESQTFSPARLGNQQEAIAQAEKAKADAARDDNIIVPNRVMVTLVTQDNPQEEVGLRFSVPDVMNGCWDISPLRYDTSSQGPFYYDVTIKDYTRKEGACTGKNRAARATVPIAKKLLEEGKIKVLRLSLGDVTDRYNVTYDNGAVEIMPETQRIFKTTIDLSYNFNKSNNKTGALIALIAPTAPAHANTEQALANFAAIYSLTPAPQNATSSLPASNGGSDIHYYYDSKKTLTPRLNGEFAPVGTTGIAQIVDVKDGRDQTLISAPVYAKKVD